MRYPPFCALPPEKPLRTTEAISKAIREAWAKCGHEVEIRYTHDHFSKNANSVTVIRSNLRNGWPPSAAKDRS